MADLGNFVQKALFLGVGIADYAAEKAGLKLQELRKNAEKLAEEMVKRGEMNMDEARKFVDDIMQQAQQKTFNKESQNQNNQANEPRMIEIVDDDDSNSQSQNSKNDDSQDSDENIDVLRQQVESLQEELHRLKID